jgi:formylglycine-generating enzyme required for sulfatase activity
MPTLRASLALAAPLLALPMFGLTGCASGPAHTDYTDAIRGSAVAFDMVWIEEGGFWIGRTEVTWDEFLLYADFEESGAIPPGVDAVTKPSKPLETNPFDRDWGTGRRPAVGVSRNAAETYCAWLSINTGNAYRLPTEAEWTLVAQKAGAGPLAERAWFAETSGGMTREVGTLAPNGSGVNDMLGNLWEYCSNPWSEDEPDRAVLRGGSWKDAADDVSPSSRLRFDDDWTLKDPAVPPGVWWIPDGDHLGFRIIRSAPASTPTTTTPSTTPSTTPPTTTTPTPETAP